MFTWQGHPTRPWHLGKHLELHQHNRIEEGKNDHSLILAKQLN
jgi:hypothetical protein